MKYLFIDGNNLGVRTAFANKELGIDLIDYSQDSFNPDDTISGEDHFPTGSIHGFFKTLNAIKRTYPYRYICVVWDGKSKARIIESKAAVEKGIVPEYYKENRKANALKDEIINFHKQRPVIMSALSFTNIPQLIKPDEEADDIIASLVEKLNPDTDFKIDEKAGGIVVSNILPFSPADTVLQDNDVLLAIDGVPVAEDGTFEFREGERLSFSHLVNEKYIHDAARIKILRDGKPLEVVVKFESVYDFIPPPNVVASPSYYIYGGLVFTVLTTDLMRSWGDKWWERAPFDFLYYLVGNGRLNKERVREVVVLLDVLPDDANIGYLDFSNEVIVKVNGHRVDSFQDFVEKIEKGEGEYAVFETLNGAEIIISRKDIDQITDQILERNNILKKSSEDVMGWM